MSTVGTPLHTFHDASGKITVTVFTSRGNPEQEVWIDQEILVGDADMVAIQGLRTSFPRDFSDLS